MVFLETSNFNKKCKGIVDVNSNPGIVTIFQEDPVTFEWKVVFNESLNQTFIVNSVISPKYLILNTFSETDDTSFDFVVFELGSISQVGYTPKIFKQPFVLGEDQDPGLLEMILFSGNSQISGDRFSQYELFSNGSLGVVVSVYENYDPSIPGKGWVKITDVDLFPPGIFDSTNSGSDQTQFAVYSLLFGFSSHLSGRNLVVSGISM